MLEKITRREFLIAAGISIAGCVTENTEEDNNSYHPPSNPTRTPTQPQIQPTIYPTPRPTEIPYTTGSNWGSPQRIISNARWPTLDSSVSRVSYIKTNQATGRDMLHLAPIDPSIDIDEVNRSDPTILAVFNDPNFDAAYPFFEYNNYGIFFIVSQPGEGRGDIYRRNTYNGETEFIYSPVEGGLFPSRFGEFEQRMLYAQRDHDVFLLENSIASLVSQYGSGKYLGDFPKASPKGALVVSSARDIIIKDISFSGALSGKDYIVINGDYDYPCWSPDGQRIAAGGISDNGIWVMNRDGSNKQKITFGHDYAPSWQKDIIAFMRNESDGSRNIYAVQEK